MGEYEPTEQELIDVFCRARETDWEAADFRANKAYVKMTDGPVRYDRDAPFGEYGSFLFRQKNYQPIPPDYMHDPAVWRGMSLSEILYNIFSQTGRKADKYREVLRSTLDRYRLAALKKLSDVTRWEKDRFAFDTNEYKDADKRHQYFCTTKELTSVDIPETPLRGWYIEFCGDSKRDEWDCVYDEHLIRKVLLVQELQKRFEVASPAKIQVSLNRIDEKQTAKSIKKPTGRRGWACEQISKMTEFDRNQFLAINSGDQQFYDMLHSGNNAWIVMYKRVFPDDTSEQFESAIEKGKQYCKKTPEILNLFTEN